MARADKGSRVIKRRLRELAAEACARELHEALRDLDGLFADWRRDRIDGFQLCDAIHEFHQGPSRRLHDLYGALDAEQAVGRALAQGTLRRDEIDDDLYPLVEASEAAFRELDE